MHLLSNKKPWYVKLILIVTGELCFQVHVVIYCVVNSNVEVFVL